MKFLILFLLASTQVASAGFWDVLDPSKIRGEIRRTITNFDLAFGEGINFDLLDGLNLSARYAYRVEPSYVQKYYSRIDAYRATTGISVGDFLSELSSPLFFSISAGDELVYVRQYNSRLDAIKALPVAPHHLPFNSDLAREMKVGDFASFPANINLMIGAQTAWENGIINASAGTHVLLSGSYSVSVFKVDASRVRMRLAINRGLGLGVRGELRFHRFEAFGLNVVDKIVDRIVSLDIATLTATQSKGNFFVLDYVFDLNDPRGLEAYDSLLSSRMILRNTLLQDPFSSSRELADRLISNAVIAEEYHNQTKLLPENEKYVYRLYKGYDQYNFRSKRFKVGLNFLKFESNNLFAEHYFTHFNENDEKREFFVPSFSYDTSAQWLWGLWKRNERNTWLAIFKTDEKRSKYDFSDFVFEAEIKDKNLSGLNIQQLMSQLKRDTPKYLTSQLDEIPQWLSGMTAKSNARFTYQVVLRRPIFDALRYHIQGSLQECETEMQKRMTEYLNLSELPPSWRERNRVATQGIVKALAQFIYIDQDVREENRAQNDLEKIRNLMKLRSNAAFRVAGIGFILSFVPEFMVYDSYSAKILAVAENEEIFEKRLGAKKDSDIYQGFLYVQSMLSGNGFDLRLQTELINGDPVSPLFFK